MTGAPRKRAAWHCSATQAGRPWSAGLSYDIGADDNENIALVHPAEGGDAVTKARARLIAAAPGRADIADEMLAAAKAVIQNITPTMEVSVDGDWLGGAIFFSDIEIAKLRDAIAKADPQWDFLKGDVK